MRLNVACLFVFTLKWFGDHFVKVKAAALSSHASIAGQLDERHLNIHLARPDVVCMCARVYWFFFFNVCSACISPPTVAVSHLLSLISTRWYHDRNTHTHTHTLSEKKQETIFEKRCKSHHSLLSQISAMMSARVRASVCVSVCVSVGPRAHKSTQSRSRAQSHNLTGESLSTKTVVYVWGAFFFSVDVFVLTVCRFFCLCKSGVTQFVQRQSVKI